MLIVMDTNFIISAALSPDGVPAKLLAKALTDHQLVFTSATFAELESRLWKPKFDRYFSLEERKAILHDISAVAIWVEVPQDVADARYGRDADDDMFIHAAIAAEAKLLITGDQNLPMLAESLSDRYSVLVSKPAAAWDML